MKKQGKGGVTVSVRLQQAVVASLVVSTAASLLFTACMYGLNRSGFSWPYAWNIIGYTLTPLAVFGLTYWLSPGYPRSLNRWFIAGIKAVAVMLVYGALQLAKNGLMVVHSRPQGTLPPQWLTSAATDYVVLALCIIAYLYVELIYKKRSHS